jgi:hypothetical protein
MLRRSQTSDIEWYFRLADITELDFNCFIEALPMIKCSNGPYGLALSFASFPPTR